MNDIHYEAGARLALDNSQQGAWRVEIRLSEHMIQASGPCPRCGHQVDVVFPYSVTDAPKRKTEGLPADPRVTSVLTVVCDCGHAHPGAPPADTGCGAAFFLEVQARDDGAMQPQQSLDLRRPADGGLTEQEPLADLFQDVFGLADQVASAIDRDEIEAQLRRTLRRAGQARDQTTAEPGGTRVSIVLSRALGVKVVDEAGWHVEHVLHANTPLPAEYSNTFFTAEEDQQEAAVQIWQQSGPMESPEPAFNQQIGEATHRFPRGVPKGTLLELSFHVSEAGMLTVRITSAEGHSPRFDLELGETREVETREATGPVDPRGSTRRQG